MAHTERSRAGKLVAREAASRVTVLLAVYNGERYLREAVDSVLAQTFSDFELLVVDDGSTDGTEEILHSYRDPRIRVLRNEQNHGLTSSLNRGLASARGEYVVRQDADDISVPERLAKQIELLDTRGDLVLVGSSHRRIGVQGEPLGLRQAPTQPTEIRWRLLFVNAFAHTSAVLRRKILDAVGAYDESFRYAQDYDLWSRIAWRFQVAAVAEPLVSYRLTSSSMTSTEERAEAEVESIARRNIARMLDGQPSKHPAVAELDLDAARRLLFGSFRRLGAEQARIAALGVMDLEQAFSGFYGLSPRERDAHRREVATDLASKLFRLGVRDHHLGSVTGAARLVAGRLLSAVRVPAGR